MTNAQDLPTQSELEKAAQLDIFDSEGRTLKFGSLFESQRVMAIFVRHFFCGSCQQYIQQLVHSDLQSLTQANIKIIIIGCGEWKVINHYAEATGFSGSIYADPSRDLYRVLGMTFVNVDRTPSGEQRKSYLTTGPISNALGSMWRGFIQNPSLIGKQGNVSQNGGEFILGPGLNSSFAYRMQHSEDHTEIADLLAAATAAS